MSKVVNLKGEQVLPVNNDLVEQLETMLEQARAGQLVGAIYAAAYADGSCRTGWQKTQGTTDALSSGLVLLNYRYGATMCGIST